MASPLAPREERRWGLSALQMREAALASSENGDLVRTCRRPLLATRSVFLPSEQQTAPLTTPSFLKAAAAAWRWTGNLQGRHGDHPNPERSAVRDTGDTGSNLISYAYGVPLTTVSADQLLEARNEAPGFLQLFTSSQMTPPPPPARLVWAVTPSFSA